MGNSFLHDRGQSFAQRRAEEHLRKARVVRTLRSSCTAYMCCNLTLKMVPSYIWCCCACAMGAYPSMP